MTGIITSALIGLFAYVNAGAIAPATQSATAIDQPATPTYSVSMTGYNAVPEQTDGDPHITASGAYSNPDIIVARSVDLADAFPFGTVVEITQTEANTPGCGFSMVEKYIGLRVVGDSMHSRKRNQIDILFDNDSTVKVGNREVNPAVALGVCNKINVRAVGAIDMKNIPRTQNQLRLAVGQLEKATDQNLAVSK